ncbi:MULTISPECIES: hypothetical protein [Planktothrix]|uniref:Uncharacterized protein n=1 Tax=Planktothrix rubescens CCAP 1459/22 TaxID=329571 RepID=A0A6J7ZTV0_PLARU|nr:MULTISPECIES: hypothetical protein [Planktothrix]CAC5345346.1 hypothetical protein PLAN_60361 [Planktothrix rubescens NIVA-CYA 18]CAD0228445.1 conserved hypothetical protein [Planktothrix agardhii]
MSRNWYSHKSPFYIESAPEFDCRRNAIRKPEETKGEHYHVTITNSDNSCCAPDSSSCC